MYSRIYATNNVWASPPYLLLGVENDSSMIMMGNSTIDLNDYTRIYSDLYVGGSVGIGTSDVCPTCTKLQVQGATTGITVFGNMWGIQAWGGSSGAALQANNSSGNGINISSTNYDIYSQGANSYFAGNVGIGAGASYKLHVEDGSDWSDSPAIYGRHYVRDNYGVGVYGEGGWIGVRGVAASGGWTDFYAGGKGKLYCG